MLQSRPFQFSSISSASGMHGSNAGETCFGFATSGSNSGGAFAVGFGFERIPDGVGVGLDAGDLPFVSVGFWKKDVMALKPSS